MMLLKIMFYSPTGKRIDSKPQLARHLGDTIDISSFDFQKGKFVQHLPPPSISLYRCLPGTTTSVTSSSPASGSTIGTISSSSSSLSLATTSGASSLPTLGAGITIIPTHHASVVGHNLKRKHKMGSQSSNLNMPSPSYTTSPSCSTTISSHLLSSSSTTMSSSTTTTTTTSTNLPLKQQQLEFR